MQVKQKQTRSIFSFYLALMTTFLALLVVVLGAYTRLTDAGLGCPDWPGCYGHWIVPKVSAISNQIIDSTKAWTEMLHRYLAGLLGIMIGVLAILSFRNRRFREQPLILPIVILMLVLFQAILGMWTVTLKLFPLVVMAHLMGGMTTLALLWWLSLTLSPTHIFVLKNPKPLKHLQLWAGLGLLVLSVQIMLGGWTSANYAALVCTDFPFCQSHLHFDLQFFKALKLTIMDLSQSYGDTAQNVARMTIHMIHRVGAIITGLIVGGLALLLLLQRSSLLLRILGWLILILLIIQISLGIANILALMLLPISVAHNAVAALLLLALVTLNFSLYKNPKHSPYEK